MMCRWVFWLPQSAKVDDSGADRPPTVDVKGLIDRIGERTMFVGMKPVRN